MPPDSLAKGSEVMVVFFFRQTHPAYEGDARLASMMRG